MFWDILHVPFICSNSLQFYLFSAILCLGWFPFFQPKFAWQIVMYRVCYTFLPENVKNISHYVSPMFFTILMGVLIQSYETLEIVHSAVMHWITKMRNNTFIWRVCGGKKENPDSSCFAKHNEDFKHGNGKDTAHARALALILLASGTSLCFSLSASMGFFQVNIKDSCPNVPSSCFIVSWATSDRIASSVLPTPVFTTKKIKNGECIVCLIQIVMVENSPVATHFWIHNDVFKRICLCITFKWLWKTFQWD